MPLTSADLGHICLIALSDVEEILAAPLRRTLSMVSPRSSISVETVQPQDEVQALTIRVDGHAFACAVFDVRIPQDHLDDACGRSIFWMDASYEMAAHTAFIAIAADAPETAHGLVRAQAVALTRLIAALVELYPALGVIWSGSGMCAAPQRVAAAPYDLARTVWPTDFWIGYSFIQIVDDPDEDDDPDADPDANPTVEKGIRTIGAAAYLGFELEIPPDPSTDLQELMRICYHATAWLMNHGDVIRDGRLVEVEGERRTRYEIDPDPRHRGGVARLRLLETDHRKLH